MKVFKITTWIKGKNGNKLHIKESGSESHFNNEIKDYITALLYYTR